MGAKLTFKYDAEGDILYIDKRPPYAEQASRPIGDEVIARLNPSTGEIETLEILFFTARFRQSDAFEVSVSAELRLPDPA